MDASMGDNQFCDADDANEYWRAHVTCEMKVAAKEVFEMLRRSFPRYTRTDITTLMLQDARYLVDESAKVHGAVHSCASLSTTRFSVQTHGYSWNNISLNHYERLDTKAC